MIAYNLNAFFINMNLLIIFFHTQHTHGKSKRRDEISINVQTVFLSDEFLISKALITTFMVTTTTAMLTDTLLMISADFC